MSLSTPSTFDTLFLGGIGLLVSVVGFMIVRTLNNIDRTMNEFATRLGAVEKKQAENDGFDRGYQLGRTGRGVVVLLALAGVLALPAHAQTPTPASFFPVPQNNASFFTTLYNFLIGGEDAARDATWSSDFKINEAGCKHPTAAGMVGTFSTTCQTMIEGDYVVEPAATINYAALGATATDFCWVIITPLVNSVEAGWTRAAGTHYMGNCTAASSARPALSGAGMYIMGTTLTAGAITAVIDETSASPVVQTYTNSSEIPGIVDRLWRGPVDGSSDQTYCFSDGLAQCDRIPSGDSAGCAICGDTATNFFSTGEIAPARGGTGDDTSASTGIPKITAGNWTYPTRVGAADGGTAIDTSGSTGVPRINSGTWSVQTFPSFRATLNAPAWGVDGTQCVLDATGQFANTNVPISTATCADHADGRIAGLFTLSGAYTPAAQMSFKLSAVQNGTDAGVLGFDFTCLCADSLDPVAAANFPSAANMDLTFDGTQSEIASPTVTMSCGGTCAASSYVFWRGAVDTAATTIATPANVKLLSLQLVAAQSSLGQ